MANLERLTDKQILDILETSESILREKKRLLMFYQSNPNLIASDNLGFINEFTATYRRQALKTEELRQEAKRRGYEIWYTHIKYSNQAKLCTGFQN